MFSIQSPANGPRILAAFSKQAIALWNQPYYEKYVPKQK